MPQLNFHSFPTQIFWLVVTFAVLYWLMAKLALPRIERIVEERRNRIESDLDRATQMKAEAEAVIAAYERALADARAQAQASMKETTERLAAESAERQRAANEALGRQVAEAERRIAAAKEAALANVRAVAIDVARAAVTRLVGTEADEARASAAVDAVLRERA
jgi:F-type H+-transporting ATPase subunit b